MRRTRDYEQLLNDAAHHLAHLTGTNREDHRARTPNTRAHENLIAWKDTGYPSSTLAGSHSGHGDLSSRIVHRLEHTDEFALAHMEIIRLTLEVDAKVRRLRKLVDAATTTKPTAPDQTSREECRLCAVVGYSNVILARGLCRWCYGKAIMLTPPGADELTLPHTDLVRRYNEGRKITLSDLARYHPIPTAGYGAA